MTAKRWETTFCSYIYTIHCLVRRDDTPIQATASTAPLSGRNNTTYCPDHAQSMNVESCLYFLSTRGTTSENWHLLTIIHSKV